MKKLDKKITAQEFDQRFEQGDMSSYLDVEKVQINKKVHRVNIDFPAILLKKIDEEAKRIGVARTALIKIWLAERLHQI